MHGCSNGENEGALLLMSFTNWMALTFLVMISSACSEVKYYEAKEARMLGSYIKNLSDFKPTRCLFTARTFRREFCDIGVEGDELNKAMARLSSNLVGSGWVKYSGTEFHGIGMVLLSLCKGNAVVYIRSEGERTRNLIEVIDYSSHECA
jgi:hypothetical protein